MSCHLAIVSERDSLAHRPTAGARGPSWLLLATLVVVASLVAGCRSKDDVAADSPLASDGGPGPQQILRKMAKAYRNASSYADSGILRERVGIDGQDIDETVDFSVSFERPNKLRMYLYQAGLVSDGKKIHATIGELEGQVLERDTPATLDVDALAMDDVLTSVMAGGIAGGSPQLGLLLTDDALQSFLTGGSAPKLIEPEKTDDRLCDRVEIMRADGRLVLWIDRETAELRRIDYPVDAMRKQLEEQGNKITSLELWADFQGAKLNDSIDPVAFEFEAPSEARIVRHFVALPQPIPPSHLLGKKLDDFRLRDLNGARVDLKSVKDRIVVLDFWATWCGPCFQSLPNLQKVYDRFKDNPKIAIIGVSIDAAEVPDAKLQEAFSKAGITIPIVRDLEAQGRDVFGVSAIPALFVLGPDGTVEDCETGFNPNLATELPERIERLLAGESLHADTLARYEQRRAEYERNFEQQQQAADSASPAASGVAPVREPMHHKLDTLWQTGELARPGNPVLRPAADGEQELWVIDAFKSLVELDARGKVGRTQPLELPAQSVVSYLRSAVDQSGKRYWLGSAANRPQVHLFDDQFATLMNYPDGEPAEIMDGQLADLDGDGKLEIVIGYWGIVGVQAADLEGQRLWQNRSVENVFSVAVVPAAKEGERAVLVTNSRGTLVPIAGDGHQADEITVANRFIKSLAAHDLDGDGRAELLAIALDGSGNEIALGITTGGDELWQYPLPPGVHEQPVEMVTAGDVLGDGKPLWIVAGADGSVNLLDGGGTLIDKFSIGEAISGLGTIQWPTGPALIVSSGKTVRAIRLSKSPPQ